MADTPPSIHASAVSLPLGGVMFIGPSGSGKSSLAAHLIETHEARLIGDDRLTLTAENDRLIAASPQNLHGLLELRGLGIVHYPAVKAGAIDLVVDLVARKQVPRLAERQVYTVAGVTRPLIKLHAFDTAAAATLKAALAHLPISDFSDDGVYRPIKGGETA